MLAEVGRQCGWDGRAPWCGLRAEDAQRQQTPRMRKAGESRERERDPDLNLLTQSIQLSCVPSIYRHL